MDVRSCAGRLGTSGKVALVKRSHSDREFWHVQHVGHERCSAAPFACSCDSAEKSDDCGQDAIPGS